MYHPWTSLLVSLYTTAVLAEFLGPTYPAPKDLTSDSSQVSSAWQDVASSIETHLDDKSADLTGASGLKNLTFSVGMFSTHDASAAGSLQYHHTSAEVANSTIGVTEVDGSSVYRVASITKLVTAFAGMLELDDGDWNRPITDFVPSLAAFAQSMPGEDDPVNTVQWDKVTLAALGSHLAGSPRDVIPYDPSDHMYIDPNPVETYGLPNSDLSDPIAFPPSVNDSDGIFPADEYAKGAQARPPTFLPWTSPQYTDIGFMMLGLAIANITNKSVHDVYRDSVFTPLNMTSSSSLPPPDNTTWKNHVIPGDVVNGGLTPEQAPEITIPSGGVFSTTNDLAKWGIAMLNSTLLPPDQTRKWMRLVSHTGHLQYAVGRPWEIYRYTHPTTGIVTDIYTKSGDSGAYGGYMVLLPDFDAGFSVLGTSSLVERSAVTPILADIITETMLPALLAQAEVEVEQNFVGTYTSTIEGLNTTLTLSLNKTEGAKPGLVISKFISNGTDVLNTTAFGRTNPLRLLPSIPDAGNGQIAFRTSAARESTGGLFSGLLTVAADWLVVDSGTYGGLATGLFVFDIDENGKAMAVRPAAWRVTLEKKKA
ncbi:MAG: hypothetical protein LQ343_007186 [Gyalolechia ehrenbergii]|nr:MAG: hypothetical protein LQ343_007186 [Gyalolechia ehrenbergii]